MECKLCDEPITNPLCQDCLKTAVAQWLQDYDPQSIPDLEHETNCLRSDEGIMCVVCKHDFSVCTYCYVKHIFNWLRDGRLQIEFLHAFNFLTFN